MDEFENLRSEFEALTEEKKDLQGQLAIANAESYVSSKSKLELIKFSENSTIFVSKS